MHKFNKGDNIKPIDKCLGEPRTICDVCDGYYITNKGILNFEFEDNWEVDEADWLKELKDMPLEKVQQSIDDIINSIPRDQKIQYANIDAAIQAQAEDYSFNIESELFNQLTPEQQKLWRKEIEQACISGGYGGLDLGRDTRYAENQELASKGLNEVLVDEAKDKWTEDKQLAFIYGGIFGANWQRQQIAKDNLLLPFKEYDNLMYSINEKKKEGYKDGYKAGLDDAIEAFKKTLLGQVEVKVIPTNFKETEFCLGDYDDIAMTTQYVKEGRLKMGDKVKILFIKTEDT